MVQETPQPNRWLISYILQYQPSRSRYEIDRELLSQGYPPSEIETAWQLVLSGQHHDLMLTPYEVERRKRSASTGCLKIGCSIFLILFALLTVQLIMYFNPSLPDPLPDYPGAIKLEVNIVTLPNEFMNAPFCYPQEAFEGRKFQIFSTGDTKEQIQNFYHQRIQERKFNFNGTEHLFLNDLHNSAGATCFSKEATAVMFSPGVPALAIRILNWEDINDAKLIAQYFPQVSPEMNVILLLQGFKYRTEA
jgi:hypothetical protein